VTSGALHRHFGNKAGLFEAVLRPDRLRILIQDSPAVLGVKCVDILMRSGFGEMKAT
jgi:AcrR family transcriptional regulator